MSGTATETVYTQLLAQLSAGVYAPGSRLVNRSVAEDLGVSVIPVREALNRLASEGLVEHIPGAGSFVRKLSARDVAKLYQFREQLEVFAAEEAAKNIQTFQLERLHRILKQEAALVDVMEGEGRVTDEVIAEWLALDASFHETLIEGADNPWLSRATGGVRLLAHVVRSKPKQLVSEESRKTLEEHRAIVDAVERAKVDDAGAIMGQHIRTSMENLLVRL